MKKNLERKQLIYSNGIYYVTIDITVNEWKEMLQNKSIFTNASLEMLKYWYEQPNHSATNKQIIDKYHLNCKGTPFNGIVIALGKRIINYLNRFEVMGPDGNKSYFILPFEGYHENYDPSKRFIWKIRSELVQAIKELNLFNIENKTYKDKL